MVELASLSISVDTTDLSKLDKSLQDVENQSGKTEKSTTSLSGSLKTMGTVAGGTAAAGLVLVTAAAVESVQVFSELEAGLISVQKTTGATDSEMDAIHQSIQELGREVPVATSALLDIATVAGQLGITGADNITNFTETIAKLQGATDIVGSEGAESIARLLNVTGEGVEQVDEFGSVLVALGNTSATTESQILALATEVAQATSTFSVTSTDAAALGATLSSLGVSAELGGSVVGRAMRAIEEDINEGGAAIETLSEVTGIAAGDLEQAFGENATAVFQKWVEGVGSMIDQGTSAAEALDMFGLGGEEVLKVLPTVAVNADQLAKSLNTANTELELGTALDKEAAAAAEGLGAQYQTLKNVATEYAFVIGESIAPGLKDAIQSTKDWNAENGELIKQDLAAWVTVGVDAVRFFIDVVGQVDDLAGFVFGEVAVYVEESAFGFEVAALKIESSWGLAMDNLRLLAAEAIENVQGNLASLPLIGEDIASEFTGAAESLRSGATATAEYEKSLAALQTEHAKNIEAIRATQLAAVELETEQVAVAEQSTETAKTITQSMENANGAVEDHREVVISSNEEIADNSEWLADQRLKLQDDLTGELIRLTESELDYQVWALDQQVDKMRETAGDNEELQKQITDFALLKQEEIYNDFFDKEEAKTEKTREEMGIRELLFEDSATAWKNSIASVTEAFVKGEDAKQAAAEAVSASLIDFATTAATQGLTEIVTALGQQIGAWVGLGTAQSGTEGESWVTKIASAGSYVAAAAAAIAAGSAVGNTFAEGGWIGRNPGGGVIAEGSGLADDVFLGFTDGGSTRNWGMGGEFVVNKESTAKYLPQLVAINGDRGFQDGGMAGGITDFAIGGPGTLDPTGSGQFDRGRPSGATQGGAVADPWPTVEAINNAAFGVFGSSLITSGFDFFSAGARTAGYYGEEFATALAGKAIGNTLFADGGVVEDKNFFLGGFLGDLISWVLDFLGVDLSGLWDWVATLPIINDVIRSLDSVIYPVVQGIMTPDGDTSENSGILDMAGQLIDGLADGIIDALEELVEDLFDPFDWFAGGGLLGSYETGTDFVPQTGPYMLHQGERVVTAGDNKAVRTNQNEMMKKLVDLVSENSERSYRELRRVRRLLDQWEGGGLPPARA